MSLQLNRSGGEDWQGTIPVVFENHLIDNENSSEENSYPITYHFDIEGIPLSYRIIGKAKRFTWVNLIIVKAA
jgi:hypothetical protein